MSSAMTFQGVLPRLSSALGAKLHYSLIVGGVSRPSLLILMLPGIASVEQAARPAVRLTKLPASAAEIKPFGQSIAPNPATAFLSLCGTGATPVIEGLADLENL